MERNNDETKVPEGIVKQEEENDSGDTETNKKSKLQAHVPRKPLSFMPYPYRKPTQVDGRESQGRRRSTAKELGKMARNFGRRGAIGRGRSEMAQATV